MTQPKCSWWSQNIWQGISGCTEACRAQIRCEEKPYLWLGGALFACQSIQDWARQLCGRAELLLAALLLWPGGCSGWPLEVSSSQHPCDLLLFTLRKAISSYGVQSSKCGAWPESCSQPCCTSHPRNSQDICAICGCALAFPSSWTICKMLLIALYDST